MKKHSNIEELFKDKLQNFEASPGPNAWANVQSGFSSTPAVASTSTWFSTAIVAVTITAVAVGGYFFFNKEGEKKTKKIETPIIQSIEVEVQKEPAIIDNIPTVEADEINEVIASEKEATSTKESLAPSAKVEKNHQNKTETLSETIEESEPTQEISEKTIDEIIAEHQASLNLEGNEISNGNSTIEGEISEKNQANNSTNSSGGKEIVIPQTNPKKSTNQLTEEEQNKLVVDQVIFPNVFSPDADGKNDVFILDLENSIEIDNIKVSIFDKTGKLVNEWSGLYNGWDGKYKNGRLAKKDSYIYKAIILKDNREYLKVNSFNLY